MRIEARGLACSRGDARLFSSVSFAVSAGEWIAFRGANGSGKTTLMRCVVGLARPDAGEVTFAGRPIGDAAGGYRGELLYAGHAPGIKDDLSATENLRDALALRGASAPEPAIRAALADVGLDARRHLPARRLSAGQRRRIGLARLAIDPATVWALDEPLTALDDAGQAHFSTLLERHLARGGIALIATHHGVQPAASHELRLGA